MQKNSLNKFMGIGRIGQKPELKYTASQMAVVNMSIATTESVKDSSGNYTDKTEWINIVVWGKTAEFVANYLDKGQLVYVEGRLQTRSWEKDNVTQYKTEVVASVVTSLSKPEQQSNPQVGGDDQPLPF